MQRVEAAANNILRSMFGNTYNINTPYQGNNSNMYTMINNRALQEIPIRKPKLLILVDLYAFTNLSQAIIINYIDELRESLWYRKNKNKLLSKRFPEDVPRDLRRQFAIYMFYFTPYDQFDQYGEPMYTQYNDFVMQLLFPERTLEIFIAMLVDLKKVGHVKLVDQLYPFKNHLSQKNPEAIYVRSKFWFKFLHHFNNLRYDTAFTGYEMSTKQKNDVFQYFNICCIGGFNDFIHNYYDNKIPVSQYTRYNEIYRVGNFTIFETRDKLTNELRPGYFMLYNNSVVGCNLKDIQFCKAILKLLFKQIRNKGVNNFVLENNVSPTRQNRFIAGPPRIVEEREEVFEKPLEDVFGGSKRSAKKSSKKKSAKKSTKKTKKTKKHKRGGAKKKRIMKKKRSIKKVIKRRSTRKSH